MPDHLTELSDEQTRAAFAALREATLGEVCAPGPDAARRVLRRRRVAVSSVAGLAVTGVALAVGAALPVLRQPAPTGEHSAPAPTGEHSAPTRPTGDPFYVAPRGDPAEPIRISDGPVDPGVHRFAVYCSGTGTGQLTLTAGAQTTAATVTCTDPPTPSAVELTVTVRADQLTLTINWNPGTVLRDTPDGWGVRVLGA